MDELSAKIKQTPTAKRCYLAAEIFPQLEAELAAIEQLSNEQDLKQDFTATNLRIDLLETATDELTIKLTDLDAPTSDLYLLSGLEKPEFLKLNDHLKQMVANYPETIATAREIDSNLKKSPPIQEVLEAIVTLSPEKLRGILELTKPTLLITPNNSFESKITALNAHPKFEDQTPVYVNTAVPGSPFGRVTSPAKPTITIVDGAQHIAHIPGIPSNSRYDERKKLFQKHFAEKGMRLINIHEYAVLMQLSLRAYRENGNDVSEVVDYYQIGPTHLTLLDDEYLAKSALVTGARFGSRGHRLRFSADRPDTRDELACPRPSLQLLAY